MAIDQAKRDAEQISGISNVTYDLMAVLTNKLEGVAAMEEYKHDAHDTADREAERLFERLQQREVEDINELRQLVRARLG